MLLPYARTGSRLTVLIIMMYYRLLNSIFFGRKHRMGTVRRESRRNEVSNWDMFLKLRLIRLLKRVRNRKFKSVPETLLKTVAESCPESITVNLWAPGGLLESRVLALHVPFKNS
jgi:hypothetical protein